MQELEQDTVLYYYTINILPTAQIHQRIRKMVEPSDEIFLCESCNHINLEDLKGADGCVHQPSFKALGDSASGCMLCKLVAEACVHSIKRERANIDVATGHLGPVRLFAIGLKSNFSGMEVRILAVLREKQLSQNVLVTVGNLYRSCLWINLSQSCLRCMH